MKKIINLSVCVGLMVMLFTGCSSQQGKTLSEALSKMSDYRTYEMETEISYSTKVNGFDLSNISSEEEIILDLFDDASAKFKTIKDTDNLKAKTCGYITVNNITGNFNMYMDGEKVWCGVPIFSKYFKADLSKVFNFDTTKEYTEVIKKVNNTSSDFLKKYILVYKYAIPNIKDNGNVTFKTLSGTSSGKEFEINMTGKQLKDFCKDSAKELFKSEDFKNYVIEMTKLLSKEDINTEELKEFMDEEMKEAIVPAEEQVEEAFEAIKLDDTSLKIKFNIDAQGNIIRIYADGKISIFDTYNEKGSIDVAFTVSNYYSSINKPINISFPTNESGIFKLSFNAGNMYEIALANFIKDLQRQMEDKKVSTFYFSKYYYDSKTKEKIKINEYKAYKYSFIRGGYSDDYFCYKNNTVYVKADIAAKAVGADFSQNGTNLEYTKGGKKLVLEVNSKDIMLNNTKGTYKNAPEKAGGNVLVPVRLIADTFNAQINWSDNDYNAALTIKIK